MNFFLSHFITAVTITSIHIVYLLTYFQLQLFLIFVSFKCSTRIKSDLPTIIILIQYSAFSIYLPLLVIFIFICSCCCLAPFSVNLKNYHSYFQSCRYSGERLPQFCMGKSSSLQFLKDLIFYEQFWAGSKIKRKVQAFLNIPWTHMFIALLLVTSPTTVIDLLQLRQLYETCHTYSWFCTFHGFAQTYDMCHHCSFIQNSFATLNNLCAPPIQPSVLLSP